MGEVSITRDEAVCSDGGSLEPSPPRESRVPWAGGGEGSREGLHNGETARLPGGGFGF